ncbi:MAG: response regulator [Pseudorhodoplanes sp.]|nr:response regulator [Pseudorhodoplanes sp.]
MAERHTALIVEDEPEMAAEIADLLRSFGHDHLHVETLADAKARLDEGGFCYVLLDLQIKADGQSIKPRVESGMSLLREIRRRFPHRSANDLHLMPVLVVSGHGKEPKNIIGAFKDGIDDFIMKPLSVDGQDVGGKIRRCLELAGRDDHGACGACNHAAVVGQAENAPTGAAFWHAPDYSEIRLHGERYYFTGDIQRAAIGFLHAAAKSDEPWRSGKVILTTAKSSDTNMRMVNLFGRHPAWGVLLLSDRRGKYCLRTE